MPLAASHASPLQSAESMMQNVSEVTTLVNLNKADVKALSSLPGIGAKKAEAIISYRELNGDFNSVEELMNVKGIGKRLVAKLATKVTV